MAQRPYWTGDEARTCFICEIEFGFFELPEPYEEVSEKSKTDQFMYIMQGSMDVSVGKETKKVGNGDVIQIDVGEPYSLISDGSDPVRLARLRPLPAAVKLIDSIPPQLT